MHPVEVELKDIVTDEEDVWLVATKLVLLVVWLVDRIVDFVELVVIEEARPEFSSKITLKATTTRMMTTAVAALPIPLREALTIAGDSEEPRY